MNKKSPSARNQAAINCTEWQLAAAQDLTDLFVARDVPLKERWEFMKIVMESIVKNHKRLLKAWEQQDAE
ncbi:hypothetical protein BCM14_2171 [Jezberella montanilacus]|uniref:Uncharacterized protein n=1 Tax=Jezberella montanilacus TaxID=323426 RepID=A0A2T0XFL0_9BURK|nr:hypothetical protein [Jezberella montanilacus]PRY97707.1 hypothetical protein BCM14_2171 [Jezberella montanilacus]